MGSKKEVTPVSQQSSSSFSGPSAAGASALDHALISANNAYMNPDPLFASLNQQLGDTLSGQYLDPASNPYLADTFNAAAQATQNRLASEFAGAGRNVVASLPGREAELQNLAAQIYGGNYQAERGRQFDSMQMVPGLADADLNAYIAQITGLANASRTSTSTGTGASSQVDYSNPWAGALGGAGTGASAGFLVGGPVGAGIGAGVGGLLGLFGGM